MPTIFLRNFTPRKLNIKKRKKIRGNDLIYYVSMFIVKDLLDKELITKEISSKVNIAFIEQYKPMLELMGGYSILKKSNF